MGMGCLDSPPRKELPLSCKQYSQFLWCLLQQGMATHFSVLAWEISHGERRLVGYSPWGRKESDTTERLTLTLGVSFNFRESSDLSSSQVTHSWWLRESLAGRPSHLDPRWDHFHFSLECSPGLGEGLAGCVALQLLLCPLMISFLNFTDVDLQ